MEPLSRVMSSSLCPSNLDLLMQQPHSEFKNIWKMKWNKTQLSLKLTGIIKNILSTFCKFHISFTLISQLSRISRLVANSYNMTRTSKKRQSSTALQTVTKSFTQHWQLHKTQNSSLNPSPLTQMSIHISWILKLVYYLHCHGNWILKHCWPILFYHCRHSNITAKCHLHFRISFTSLPESQILLPSPRDSRGIHRIPAIPFLVQLSTPAPTSNVTQQRTLSKATVCHWENPNIETETTRK